MSQPESDAEEPAEVRSTPVHGTIEGIERTFLRLTFWQTILSLAGVFTGAVALYAALNESQAVRQQTAASVWPYVQLMINDSSDGESAHFALSLDNVGVGPAKMQGLMLTLNGTAQRNWASVADALLDRETELGTHYGQISVSRRVLAPGESVVAFQTHDAELALRLQEAVYSGAAELSYCYCSIFDECWSKSSAAPGDEETIQPEAHCPDYGAGAFMD